MAKFGNYCRVASSYADVADFVAVYIEEAHAADGWDLKNNIKINIHQQIEDRIEAAKILLVENPSFPIVCDDMAENANYAYGGLSERLFVIHRGKIVYEGGRGPVFYFLSEVQEWLATYKERVSDSSYELNDGKVTVEQVQPNIEKYSGTQKLWAKLLVSIFKI